MATEFEIQVGARAAMQAAPGMGGFSAREIAKAVIEAVDRVRTASTVTRGAVGAEPTPER